MSQTEFTAENTSLVGKPVKVIADGNEVKWCLYANTSTGEVKYHTGRVIDGDIEIISLIAKDIQVIPQ